MKFKILFILFLILNNLYAATEEENTTPDLTLQITDAPLITQGSASTSNNNDGGLIETIQYQINPNDIIEMKKKQEILDKVKANKLLDYKGKFRNILYKEGFVNVTLRRGYATLLSFQDEFGNNIPIQDFIMGEDKIKVTQTSTNRLVISANQKYFETNIIVLLKDYDKPVHIKINENLIQRPDTQINILLPNYFNKKFKNYKADNYFNKMSIKRDFTIELLKKGTISNSESIKFSIIDLKSGKISNNYDILNKIKIFKIKKFNQKYLMVAIDNKYSLSGHSYDNFSRYNNTQNIYFINPNTQILLIANKKMDYSEDINFIEKKSINNFRDFKRYKLLLEN
jgi:hypothetical protein